MNYSQIHFRKKQFMTDTEYNFFMLLHRLFGEHYLVFSQVRVEDIVSAPDKNPDHRKFIRSHSVDFLLVSRTERIRYMVIELNDITHLKPNRYYRDANLNTILGKAGIPYIVQHVHAHYDEEQVRKEIMSVLSRHIQKENGLAF